MSWQSYVDTNLVGSGYLTKAAIFGHDGSQWAISPGFNVSAQEAQAIFKGLKNDSDLPGTGVHLEGLKFMCLRADADIVYARKEKTGVCIKKCEKCFLIGVYDCEVVQPGQANIVVEQLGDYLVSSGY